MSQTAVIIGRFQPCHKAHIETLIKPAIEQSEQTLILFGSSFKARDIKNPFTSFEREDIIIDILKSDLDLISDCYDINFLKLHDYPYNNLRWQIEVQQLVTEYADYPVVLYGAEKDTSSFYLKFFPEWNYQQQTLTNTYSATKIRETLFGSKHPYPAIWNCEELYPTTKKTLINFIESATGIKIKAEYEYIQAYKAQFASSPYPLILHTVDNVVLWRDKVLLIQRANLPGQGLWALPGGFVEASEWLYKAAIRELEEETNILVKKEWLHQQKTFDHPNRSLRGRTITEAFYWDIPDSIELNIIAKDDASKIQWFTPYTIFYTIQEQLFEDHIHIIDYIL